MARAMDEGSRPQNSELSVNGLSPTSPKAWAVMSYRLNELSTSFTSVDTIAALVESPRAGRVIVDVRPENEYKKGSIPGAVSVPIYRLIQGWDAWKILRRAGFALFGVFNGTEFSETFEEDMRALIDGGASDVVLVCSSGGTLEPTEANPHGRQR
jgi:rhodanese-related sulfurtransferase